MSKKTAATCEVAMTFNYFIIVVLCCFVLPFSNCFNLTQSLAELIIGDLIHEFDISKNSDTSTSPIQVSKNERYHERLHTIQTEDGYLLKYYRLQAKAKNRDDTSIKPFPVLLHHGLLSTWNDWIIQGPEKSLAYQLVDEGFDVWIGNSRGNTYAKKHEKLQPSQKEFWNFTFHEMGILDISKGIDYILHATGKKQLIYIGHSQGTTILYTLLSTNPEYNEKIFFHIGVAPIAAIPSTTSSIKQYAPHAKEIAETIDRVTNGSYGQHSYVSELFYRTLCNIQPDLCERSLFSVLGESPQQFNKDLIFNKVLKYDPAGTSTKNMVHMAQLIHPGKFTHFDSDVAYNISKITAPIQLYYGPNDPLANKHDAYAFYKQLPNPLGCEAVAHEQWNHADFIYGIDVKPLFNDKVVQFMVEATTKPGFIQQQIQKSLQERSEKSPYIGEVPNKDVFRNSSKVPHIPLRVMGSTMKEIQVIVNTSIRSIRIIMDATIKQVDEVVRKSLPLIKATIGTEQEPAEFLKELEDFYREVDGDLDRDDNRSTTQ